MQRIHATLFHHRISGTPNKRRPRRRSRLPRRHGSGMRMADLHGPPRLEVPFKRRVGARRRGHDVAAEITARQLDEAFVR
jgi:hypothetical protein